MTCTLKFTNAPDKTWTDDEENVYVVVQEEHHVEVHERRRLPFSGKEATRRVVARLPRDEVDGWLTD